MNLDRIQNRILELMSIFVYQVEGATVMKRTDINKVSEIVLIPLFAEIFGYKNLKSLNVSEHADYPGIDMGDEVARVAFQVTSSSDSEKIKDSLRMFVKHGLHKKYDRLIVYILTHKQKSYSGNGYTDITKRNFTFRKETDIKDFRDLLAEVKGFQIDQARRIEDILEANFGNRNAVRLFDVPKAGTEDVYLNLLGLSFPKNLYVADLTLDRKEIVANSRVEGGSWLKNAASTREVAFAAMKQRGLKFGTDWECHENRVITFHDLSDEALPLSGIIDKGTVTPLNSERYYTINGTVDENRERVFKSLLRRCLQQKLFSMGVCWQNQVNRFIFVEADQQPHRFEQWYGEKENERTVFERTMKNNKPDEILICKHLAFGVQFKRFGAQWYLLINPDWFFSWDGYRRSRFAADKLKWLKKEEDNKQVFNHFRFLVYFLTHDKPPGLFEHKRPYRFLTFGEITKFNSAPILNDEVWNPPKSSDDTAPDVDDDSQGSLNFSL
jgi:hypothetical protein